MIIVFSRFYYSVYPLTPEEDPGCPGAPGGPGGPGMLIAVIQRHSPVRLNINTRSSVCVSS